MSKSYLQLQKQIETLQKEAEKVKRAEVAGVISRIKEAIRSYGLTAEDLGFTASAPAAAKSNGRAAPARARPGARAPKFRNSTGQVWSGRGPRPKWLRDAIAAGQSLDEFAV